MNFDLTIIKRHPWATVGIVLVGGILLYYLLFAGGSEEAGTTIVSGAPNDQSNALSAQAADQQFQLAYLQAKQAGDFALANLQAQTSTTQQVNAIQGQLAIQGQQIESQTEIEKIKLDNDKYLANLQSQTMLQSQLITQTTALQLSQMQTQANIAINAANVDLQKSIAQYQTTALTQIARYNVQQQESSDTLGAIVSIAGIAASFFSDRRLKSNIVRVGTHKRLGIGIYEYDIFGKRQTGVMADEVMRVMPEAVMLDPNSGNYLVDYGKIAA
jgi:hypothetical protein